MKLTQRGASRTRDLVKKENGEQFILFIFLKKVFFGSGPFLESLLNLLHHCFCFTFWFLGHEACRTSGPRAGVESTPPAPEGEVLTTRNQGCPWRELQTAASGDLQASRSSACPQTQVVLYHPHPRWPCEVNDAAGHLYQLQRQPSIWVCFHRLCRSCHRGQRTTSNH